jgi:hypothetical protein
MPINEKWMSDHAPAAVTGYNFQPVPGMPDGQSYRMSDSTYKTLQPSGILARYYVSGGKGYDVVLIASDNSVSFHDPRVCFTASGWNIIHQKQTTVHSQVHGDVPVTLVQMEGDGQKSAALYFYRSPSGYESVARKMRWDMLVGELLHGRNDQGVFYRFIPLSPDATEEETREFAGKYLDEANRASGGFF